jgi:hypothetical protein
VRLGLVVTQPSLERADGRADSVAPSVPRRRAALNVTMGREEIVTAEPIVVPRRLSLTGSGTRSSSISGRLSARRLGRIGACPSTWKRAGVTAQMATFVWPVPGDLNPTSLRKGSADGTGRFAGLWPL